MLVPDMVSAERIPVLMYHRVGRLDHSRDIYCIEPERFEAQMNLLAEKGWSAVNIDEFNAWRQGEIALKEKSFVLTFDDGFEGVHDFAAPVLKNLNWSAAVFLVTGKIGNVSDWNVTVDIPMPPHRLMNLMQIESLIKQGFSFHSHSLMHHDLCSLDAVHLEEDLVKSYGFIKSIDNSKQIYIAYPYGRHNKPVIDAVRRVGYSAGFSVECGFNHVGQDEFNIRRIDVLGTDTPKHLFRKVQFGTNDGGVMTTLRYYFRRALNMVS